MIRKVTGFSRRIFAFPAVYPCDSVRISTLVASLTDLAADICAYKSKRFSTNARNAGVIIRLVSNLIPFFDEIRGDAGSGLPDSVSLCFSELHLDLQKIRFMLEDCTGEGARLLMAVKSEEVANQFRVFARAMAVALDILPLRLLDIPNEVKELVQLVKNQAQRAIFGVDPGDQMVMENFLFVLNQFENGIEPDLNTVKRVLNSIGVLTWSDCNSEIKLLDTEIGFEFSNDEEKRRKLSILSGLMSFMVYSRCLLFDSIDVKIPQIDDQFSSQLLRSLNSDDFRCPISLEMMKDPVTIETGHTYDRSSILKWFRAGNRTCPSTGKRLETIELTPNSVLKGLIQSYCIENGIPAVESRKKNRDISGTIHPLSLAAEGALKMVAGFLCGKLANGDEKEKSKAAYEIRLLSKASIFNRYCLLEAGVIPYLLKLLLSSDCLCQENSIAGLLNLSKHPNTKSVIVDHGGVELIVYALKNGLKMEAKQHAAATLFYLASIDEYRRLIGENREAIPGLLQLIKDGSNRARKNGLVAIFGLLMDPSNHCRVIQAAAVPLIHTVLTSTESEEIMTDSLAVLSSLAEKPEGAKAVIRYNPLPRILGILDAATSRAAKEQCVCLLLALCINGGSDVLALLVKSHSLMVSLYSQMSEGTSRASKKASSLIRVLHEFHEKSSKTLVFPRERPVHVW